MNAGFGRFYVPGPTEVRADILQAMTRPMIPHRGKQFETFYAGLQVGLRTLFATERTVIVSTSSATGMMEAAVRCAPPGAVVSVVNGAFSKRFSEISIACGRETVFVEAPYGEVVPLHQIEGALAGKPIAAVTVVHSETSTGARTDVRAVTELARRYGALCLVDSVSGVGGIPLEFDAWDLDFVLTGSQKALALPPGLAFAVASDRYLATADSNTTRGRYLDIAELQSFAQRNSTPATPSLSLMYALEAQLESIRAEGMPARWARHAQMAAMMVEWTDASEARTGHRLGILAPAGSRCETVSAVTLPDYLTGPEVVAAVAKLGFTLGEGYGELKQRTFRVGHMGDHTPDGLRQLLEAIDEVLRATPRKTNA